MVVSCGEEDTKACNVQCWLGCIGYESECCSCQETGELREARSRTGWSRNYWPTCFEDSGLQYESPGAWILKNTPWVLIGWAVDLVLDRGAGSHSQPVPLDQSTSLAEKEGRGGFVTRFEKHPLIRLLGSTHEYCGTLLIVHILVAGLPVNHSGYHFWRRRD